MLNPAAANGPEASSWSYVGSHIPASAVRTIQRDELERELAVNKGLRLVMTLPKQEFEEMHIPGSLHFDTSEAMLAALKPNDEVVIYCTNPECLASQRAYGLLVQRGYTNVRRYAGGLEDWSEAGLPLEGRQGQGSSSK